MATRVIYMEYRKGKPVSAIAVTDEGKYYSYDINWCKRDRIAYYHPGCGPTPATVEVSGEGRSFWAAPEIEVIARDGATRRERRGGAEQQLERALAGEYLDAMAESACEYCPTCDDYLPSGDVSTRLCDHCWWCVEAGWWSVPGERCPWDCRECRRYGLERTPPPPNMLIAQGYGRAAAALTLARIVRQVLRDRGLTPESLADCMGLCDDGPAAIRAATKGVVHPAVSGEEQTIAAVARNLDLSPDVQEELLAAFGFDD